MTNYKELFERLAKCQLPAGVEIDTTKWRSYGWDSHVAVSTPDGCAAFSCLKPKDCRAALMLIVDAMRAEGWWFTIQDYQDVGIPVRGHLVQCHHGCPPFYEYTDTDQVTALAECLIAALGPREEA